MHPHIAVLSPAGVSSSIGMEADGVDGSKMSLHPCKLFLKHKVEETCVELANSGGGGGDVHSLLTATHYHMRVGVHERGDGSRVNGSVSLIHLEGLQIADVPESRRGVLAGGDKHHAIMTQLHVLNLLGVLLSDLNLMGIKNVKGKIH